MSTFVTNWLFISLSGSGDRLAQTATVQDDENVCKTSSTACEFQWIVIRLCNDFISNGFIFHFICIFFPRIRQTEQPKTREKWSFDQIFFLNVCNQYYMDRLLKTNLLLFFSFCLMNLLTALLKYLTKFMQQQRKNKKYYKQFYSF